MPFKVSPGIVVTEYDKTNIIPAVTNNVGGGVLHAPWGPVEQVVTSSREDELVRNFGEPVGGEKDSGNGVVTENVKEWYILRQFLRYANDLRTVRVISGTASGSVSALNAGSDGNAALIKNENGYESFTQVNEEILAKYPGHYGNSLEINICDAGGWANYALTGTVTTAALATTLVGSGTLFTEEIYAGAVLTIDGMDVVIESVESDTAATLSEAATETKTGDSATCAEWEYAFAFDGTPATSDNVSARGGSLDELHIVVVDVGGKFSGISGTILETYAFVSKAFDAKDTSGNPNNWSAKLEGSKYIWAVDDIFGDGGDGETDFTSQKLTTPYKKRLSGGRDGDAPIIADYMTGFDMFSSAEVIPDIAFLIVPPMASDSDLPLFRYITSICENRMDLVSMATVPYDCMEAGGALYPTTAINEWVDDSNINTTYTIVDCSWKRMYDRYSGKYRVIPMCGDTAGLCARSDDIADPWISPAGYNRGLYKDVVSLLYNPVTETERDSLYRAGINPIVDRKGTGVILLGDKMFTSRPTAFSRINVRRLFITLEKSISTAAKYMLFELNNVYTQSAFRSMVEPFLREVQGKGGIEDFRVICDERNNTTEVKQRNEFIADIYVKPNYSINYIYLNAIAVSDTGDVSFSLKTGG